MWQWTCIIIITRTMSDPNCQNVKMCKYQNVTGSERYNNRNKTTQNTQYICAYLKLKRQIKTKLVQQKKTKTKQGGPH